MHDPLYNTIGVEYNTTRKADPYITERIIANLLPAEQGKYLDLGCGTGNYLAALTRKGYTFYGIDPSERMLEIAREQCPEATLLHGMAEATEFEGNFFDGAICMFTLHHWSNLQQGLYELYRVVKKGGRVVFLSFTPQQMEGYWLNHYFPKMIARSGALVPAQEEMVRYLNKAGFTDVTTEKYFVHEGLEDHFLYSNKHHPEKYLDPTIRQSISSFAAFSTPEEVAHGLKLLEADIASGSINEVMMQYENELGDYLFYTAVK